MRSYELVLVLNPDTGEEKNKKLIDTLKGWLGKADLEVTSLGKKPLAYKIKKHLEGAYYLVDIVYKEEEIIPADFEKKLKTEDSIIRHLLVRTKEVKVVERKKKSGNSLTK